MDMVFIGTTTTNKEGKIMKKSILLVLLTVLVCLNVFSGCRDSHKENISQSSKTNISETQGADFVTSNNNEQIMSSDEQDEGYGGGMITVQKYRTRFYSIPGVFADLVGRDNYYEWINTVDYTESAEKMVMLQFIQYFGISREQFDKANLQFAKIVRDDLDGRPCMNPKDYANQIDDEIFNGDVIFTFDDAVINEYYLSPEYPYLYAFEYDEDVEKGEYSSKTEVWVDIEQMEAEIIAKYGEIEQVKDVGDDAQPTEVAVIPEETTLPEQTEAVTIS